MNKNYKTLFKNLCCSRCKAEFENDSVTVISREEEYIVLRLKCNKCGKDFGTAFMKITSKTSKDKNQVVLKDKRDVAPINYDDVIDAYRAIKDIEKNWKKFIEET